MPRPMYDTSPDLPSRSGFSVGGVCGAVINSDSPISELNKVARLNENEAQCKLMRQKAQVTINLNAIGFSKVEVPKQLTLDHTKLAFKFLDSRLVGWVSLSVAWKGEHR